MCIYKQMNKVCSTIKLTKQPLICGLNWNNNTLMIGTFISVYLYAVFYLQTESQNYKVNYKLSRN